MSKILIKNATIVNEDEIFVSDVLIDENIISQIDKDITDDTAKIIDAKV
jgi:dihydroorotase